MRLAETPFDVLAEGFLRKASRGDWTPLKLFLAGVRVWEAPLQQRLDDRRKSGQECGCVVSLDKRTLFDISVAIT